MRESSDEEIVAISTDTSDAAPVKRRRIWLRWAIGVSVVGLLLCLALGGLRSSFTLFRNGGDGMVPTVADRQMLLVNRLSYTRGGTPQRGDLVVFEAPLRTRAIYVKRIIALPGDTVAIRQGIVSINGQPIDEPYINARTTYQWATDRRALYQRQNDLSISARWSESDDHPRWSCLLTRRQSQQ